MKKRTRRSDLTTPHNSGLSNSIHLQHNHSDSASNSHGHVNSELEVTDVDSLGTTGNAGAGSRRGSRTARSSSGSSIRSNETGAGGTSLGHVSLARAGGGGSRLGGSGATPAASRGGVTGGLLLLVVLVQDEDELLLAVAHAVGAVLAGGAVAGDTGAGHHTANLAHQVTDVVGVEGILDSAGGGVDHALTEISVGSRGKGRGLGLPGGVLGRAAAEGGVGGGVGGLVGAAGGGAGDFLGVVAEIGHGADAGTVDDGDQACRWLEWLC